MNHCDTALFRDYKAALDLSRDIMAIVDADHVYTMVNQTFRDYHKCSAEEIIGRHARDILGDGLYRKTRPHLQSAFLGNEVAFHLDVSYPEKGQRRMHVRYTPLQHQGPDVERVLMVVSDITHLRELEETTMRHEATYALLFHDSHEAMFLVDPVSGLIVDSNSQCSAFYGHSRDELCLTPLQALEAPGCEGDILGARNPAELPLLTQHRASVGIRDVEVWCSPLRLGNTQLLHVTVHDVTDSRLQARRNAFLASIVASTHDAVIGKSIHGEVMSWNAGAEVIYGFSEQEMLGTNICRIVPDARREEWKTLMARVGRGERVDNHETQRLRKDGSALWVSLILSPIRDDRGEIVGISTIASDITNRIENQRRMSTLAAVVDQSAEGLAVMDAACNVEYINEAFARLVRVQEQQARGRQLRDILRLQAGDHEGGAIFDHCSKGETWAGRIVLCDEQPRTQRSRTALHARTFSVTPPGLARPTRVCVLRDLSREESLEHQLRHAQKMEALGTLASGVAHDFNNILASIMVNAETAGLLAGDMPQMLKDCLTDISISSKRGGELVKNILTYCRQSEQEFKTLQLQPVVKEALKLLRSTLPPDIVLRQNLQAGDAVVLADPSQIHQVLMNLAVNAVQAMEKGGELAVELHVTPPQTAESDEESPAAGEVLLQVRDQGAGVPPEHLDRLCDPFFTTKKPGEGTGLGLSIVLGIVTSHGGRLDIRSTPGQGTTVSVHLPLVAAPDQDKPVSKKALLPGSGRLLVVDDDSGVLASWQRGLEALGYECTCCDTPQQALEAFRGAPNSFDMLLFDQRMPGLSGVELLAIIREEHPELPAILCSGDSTSIDTNALASLGACELLAKPVSIIELHECIRRMLHTPRT